MKPFPDPKQPNSKIRNRSEAYLRLLTFTRGAPTVKLLPKLEVRARLWRAQAERLAEILQRDFATDLANPALVLNCRLPWQPRPARPRSSRVEERIS